MWLLRSEQQKGQVSDKGLSLVGGFYNGENAADSVEGASGDQQRDPGSSIAGKAYANEGRYGAVVSGCHLSAGAT